MKAITVDIKDYLIANTDYVFGTDLFVSKLPGTPVNCIVLFNTSAAEPEKVLEDNGIEIENGMLQVIIRNTNYETAYVEAYNIKNCLDDLHGVTINGTDYMCITLSNGPNELDDSGMLAVNKKTGVTLLSLNFRIKRIIN